MSGEIDQIRQALEMARRAYHDSTRWCEEQSYTDELTTFEDDINTALVAADQKLKKLEGALRAIMEAHGPGTLASDEIYEQACVALNGPRQG